MNGFVELDNAAAAAVYGGKNGSIAEIVKEIGRIIGKIARMIDNLRKQNAPQSNKHRSGSGASF